MNLELNPNSITSPNGKTFPEYVNPQNIPIRYVSLDNIYMRQAYTQAKQIHATDRLTQSVKKMTITSSIVVQNDAVVGKGINGDGWHQSNNRCIRIEKGLSTGVGYDQCPGCHGDNHAERVALRQAGEQARGANLYLYGHWWICASCWNAITEAGIAHIYMLDKAEYLFDRNESTSVIGTSAQYAGKIIVIEGSDGTGKGTQAELITTNLMSLGYSVISLGFPRYKSGNIGGSLLYHVLKSEEAHTFLFSKLDPYAASLLYVMDRVESTSYIHNLLQQYDFVIMDRYYTANLLHQGAKFEDMTERNKFLDTMYNIEVTELQVPKADIVIYLTLPFEVSIERIAQRNRETGAGIDEVEKDRSYIQQSIERGLSIAEYLGWHIIQGVEFASDGKTITKEYSKEERQERLLSILKDKKFI